MTTKIQHTLRRKLGYEGQASEGDYYLMHKRSFEVYKKTSEEYGKVNLLRCRFTNDSDEFFSMHREKTIGFLRASFNVNPVYEIELGGGERIALAKPLANIYDAIQKSRYILSLDDDWDDEGSIKYDPETWKKTIRFIARYASDIYEKFRRVIATPKIYHSVNGSIDVLWKNEKYQLLVNIPSEGDCIKFYGDDYDKSVVEGTFELENYKLGLVLALVDFSNVEN